MLIFDRVLDCFQFMKNFQNQMPCSEICFLLASSMNYFSLIAKPV